MATDEPLSDHDLIAIRSSVGLLFFAGVAAIYQIPDTDDYVKLMRDHGATICCFCSSSQWNKNQYNFDIGLNFNIAK